MAEDACILDPEQRALVEKTIADHCQIRGWELQAVNCRTNHLHVVVSAPRDPDEIRIQFKAWCTRRLKELERKRSGMITEDEPRLRVGLVLPSRPTQWASETIQRTEAIRENWRAERGSGRYLNDGDSLEAAITYVRDGQDAHPD